jgi:hypothetical protein
LRDVLQRGPGNVLRDEPELLVRAVAEFRVHGVEDLLGGRRALRILEPGFEVLVLVQNRVLGLGRD